ncbi:MAG TPA: ABC transporter permease [Candidatus Acetothermia bacterium]|nr:ABC transporter permease [Candidatus Acetothermia bacterium]
MFMDNLRLATHNLVHRRLRSWLTILGIVVGVAAVLALISIGEGMQRAVKQQFETVGYSTILLAPSSSSEQSPQESKMGGAFRAMAGNQEPSEVDLSVFDKLPQVESYGAIRVNTGMGTSENMQGTGFLHITGLSSKITDYFSGYFQGFNIAEGRNFIPNDENALILGNKGATDLGVAVGDTVKIESTDFKVIGVLAPIESRGGALTFRGLDTGLFVPIAAMERLYGGENKISQALIQVTDGTDVVKASQAMKNLFTQLGTPVATPTAEEISKQIMGVLSGIQMALTAIAVIALVVGAIGVMNTMYTSVLERTRHIGIMKAIGAKDRHVMGLFLTESGMLGIVGGAIGVLAGVGIGAVAGKTLAGAFTMGPGTSNTAFAPYYSPWLIIGTLVLSLVLGALAGALPAHRAAKLKPVEALRYE